MYVIVVNRVNGKQLIITHGNKHAHTLFTRQAINSTPYSILFFFLLLLSLLSLEICSILSNFDSILCADDEKKKQIFLFHLKTRIERKERKRTLMATRCWLTIPRPIFRYVFVCEWVNDGERAISYLGCAYSHNTFSHAQCTHTHGMRRSLPFHFCICSAHIQRTIENVCGVLCDECKCECEETNNDNWQWMRSMNATVNYVLCTVTVI